VTPYFQDAKSGITIFHGDAYELLPALMAENKFDICVTDPPYEVAAKGGGIAGKAPVFKKIKNKMDGGFDVALLDRFENWVCFCGKQQLRRLVDKADDSGDSWMLVTCWKESPTPLTNNVYLPDVEFAVHKWKTGRLFGEYKDKSRFVRFPNERGAFSHPTVKPLSVITKFINLGSRPGELVLDPFMGTGTTPLACKLLGRRCVAVEIEERWCEIAAQRLAQGVLL